MLDRLHLRVDDQAGSCGTVSFKKASLGSFRAETSCGEMCCFLDDMLFLDDRLLSLQREAPKEGPFEHIRPRTVFFLVVMTSSTKESLMNVHVVVASISIALVGCSKTILYLGSISAVECSELSSW